MAFPVSLIYLIIKTKQVVPTYRAAVGKSLGEREPPFPACSFPDHTIKHAAKFIFQCDFLEENLPYFRSSRALSALSIWGKGREIPAKQSLLDCFLFVAFQHTVYLNQISPTTFNSNVATLWAQIYEEITTL